MLLQTNSYIVPKERRAEHARLIRRFRQALAHIGCDQFDVYEQIGANWDPAGANGRYVQLMRFRDHQHQADVQNAERQDAGAQAIIAEFCALINFPYQQQHGYFATAFYTSVLPVGPKAADEPMPAAAERKPAAQGHAGSPASGTQIARREMPAELPEPDAAERVALTHERPAFGETAIAGSLAEERQAFETLGVAPEPDVVEMSDDLTAADKRALADASPGLDAFGLSEEPAAAMSALAEEPPAIPESMIIERAPDLEFRTNPPAPYETASHSNPATSEFSDDSDLLDLSEIELTDDEAAAPDEPPLEMADEESAGISAHNVAGDDAYTDVPIMLDATLPEEDAFGNLLDDTNIRDHAPLPGNGQSASVAQAGHNSSEAYDSSEPAEKDADLLEFDAYLRQLKEGSAEQRHR